MPNIIITLCFVMMLRISAFVQVQKDYDQYCEESSGIGSAENKLCYPCSSSHCSARSCLKS